MAARDHPLILARRNWRARRLGWTSYGQERYWLAQFGVHRGHDGSEVIDKDRQQATALRLGRRICPDHPEEHSRRAGSYFCRKCDLLVNGNGREYAEDGTRRGDWRARLVRVASGYKGGRRLERTMA